MIYHVTARLREETASGLLSKLNDGTIANQRPDGPELVASMARAVVNEAGEVEWSEMCLCPSPLLHERTTVLEYHFDDIRTEELEAHEVYSGRPFLEHLRGLADGRKPGSP